MENQILSRKYLEALTNQELIVIADDYGLDIPENLNRRFMIEEIFDCVEEQESETEADKSLNITDEETPVELSLPKTYNETKIRAVLRDPAWVYVFWDISAQDKAAFEQNRAFKGLELHVSFFETDTDESPKEMIDVNVSKEDRNRYVFLSSHLRHFVITLECAMAGRPNQVLAFTKRMSVPEGNSEIANLVPGKEIDVPPLVKLSGLETILRQQYLSHRELFADN